MAVNKVAKIRKEDKINGVFWREHLSELEKNLITFSFTASKQGGFFFSKRILCRFYGRKLFTQIYSLKTCLFSGKSSSNNYNNEGKQFLH